MLRVDLVEKQNKTELNVCIMMLKSVLGFTSVGIPHQRQSVKCIDVPI